MSILCSEPLHDMDGVAMLERSHDSCYSALCVEIVVCLRSIVISPSTLRPHTGLCCSAAAWPTETDGAFFETRPRMLGRPAERHISKFPEGLSIPVKKRTAGWVFVRMSEFIEFREAYVDSSTDTMIRVVNGDIPVKAESFCADGVEYLKCFTLFSQCMLVMFPHDAAMRQELIAYGNFIAEKYKILHPAIVAKIDDLARVFAFKHHCAFWPLAPEVLAEIITLSSGNKVATCHICNLPGHFAANCRSTVTAAVKPLRGRGVQRRVATAPAPSGPIHSSTPAAASPGPCRNWNLGVACAKSPCAYPHICGVCGVIHNLSQCPDKGKAAALAASYRTKSRASR